MLYLVLLFLKANTLTPKKLMEKFLDKCLESMREVDVTNPKGILRGLTVNLPYVLCGFVMCCVLVILLGLILNIPFLLIYLDTLKP